jgi:hypothetical protein
VTGWRAWVKEDMVGGIMTKTTIWVPQQMVSEFIEF